MIDFENALEEVKPQFGVDTNKLDTLVRNSLINYGARFEQLD